MTDAGTPLRSRAPSLPLIFRPKRSFRWTGYAGLVLCAALITLALFGMFSSDEGVPERMRTGAGLWIFLLSVPVAFGAFVLLRLNLAHGSLRISDTHVELRTPLGLRRIAWSEVGRVELRSVASGGQNVAGLVGGLAFGAALGMATGIHVSWHPRSGVGYPRVFLTPSSSTRRRLAPTGRVSRSDGRVAIGLSEAYDWDAFDALRTEALARGITVIADDTDLATIAT